MTATDFDWHARLRAAAEEWLAADAAYCESSEESERLMVLALAAEQRLVYAMLRELLTSADSVPDCVDSHMDCWLDWLRAAVPDDWPEQARYGE